MSIENLKEFQGHLNNISKYQKYKNSYAFSKSTFFKYNSLILAFLLFANLYFIKDSVEHPTLAGAFLMGSMICLPVVGVVLFWNYFLSGEYSSFIRHEIITKNYKKSLQQLQGRNLQKYFNDVFSLIKKYGQNHDEYNFRNIINVLGNNQTPGLDLLHSFESALGDYIKKMESSPLYTIDYFEIFKKDLENKVIKRLESEQPKIEQSEDNIQFFQKT